MYGLWYTILSNIFRLVSNQYSNRIDDDDDDNDDRFIAVRDVYMCVLCCVVCCVLCVENYQKKANKYRFLIISLFCEYDLFYF